MHGTILFARWPKVLRLLRALARIWSRGASRQPAWYEEDSPFVKGLRASLAARAHVTPYLWSGGNSVWDRIWAAGAEGDFGMPVKADRPPSLRQHIAKVARDYPDAAQVLVAHSHGGNVCLYALRDAATRRAVHGLVCLSTPFVHARKRPDAGALADMLTVAGALAYLGLFIGLSQWLSARLAEPWDSIVFISGFSVAAVTAALFWRRGHSRRRALRAWAESIAEPVGDGPPTLVLLSDGDEALLALKIAEGLGEVARGLWRVAFWLPSRVHHRLGQCGRWRLVIYGVLTLVALVALLFTDAQSPWGRGAGHAWSLGLALTFLAVAAIMPMLLYLALVLALATPALAVLLLAYPALVFSRWLAFGWGGSVGMDITAETCPLGTATTTRLAEPVATWGLRHAHSYNHPRAPHVVGGFIARAAGTGSPTP